MHLPALTYTLFPYTTLFRSGTKHPRSMGQRGDECWAEIWNVCGPLYRHVMTTGDSAWSADLQLLMERDGYLEERSEEHKSELQSRQFPVCGLLLETKISF